MTQTAEARRLRTEIRLRTARAARLIEQRETPARIYEVTEPLKLLCEALRREERKGYETR